MIKEVRIQIDYSGDLDEINATSKAWYEMMHFNTKKTDVLLGYGPDEIGGPHNLTIYLRGPFEVIGHILNKMSAWVW